ncbi:MAG: extracellular solute-binding protein [Chloroflexi bacterium]|nr:extracellular solute-binding protein [Chloroflexota bacterium]
MRKWFSTMVALLLVFAMLLTSCAPKPTPTPTPKPGPTTPPPKPTATPVPKVTITMWEQEDEAKRNAVLYPLVNEFMAANPNIVVEVTNYGNEELRTQFQTASLAGEAPEIIRCPNDFAGPFSVMGILLPITDMFDQAFLDNFVPGALAGGVVKGTLWGIPDSSGNHLMLLYNKKLVPTPPADSDQLIQMAKQLTDEAAGQWGLAYNTQEPFWLAPFLGGFGGWVLDDKTDMPTLNTPAMVDALQFMADLSLKHKVVPPGCDYNTMDTLFKEGKAAMIINGDWSLTGYLDAGVDFGVAPIPKITKTGLWPSPMTSGKYYMISAAVKPGTPKFEAVKKFIEFMTSEHAQQMWLEKSKVLPSHKQVAQSPIIQQDPILQGSMAQLEKGRGMPAAPELRCFWDSARPGQQGVIAGTVTPAEAAKKMQEDADRCIMEAGLGVKKKVRVGQVTDMGGIDDKSFNATAWKGIQDAMEKLGAEGKYLESQVQADYAKNIQQFLDEKLDLIVTVGFLLGVDTAKAAMANPNQKFAIVDYSYPDCWPGAVVGKDCGSDKELPNVLGLTFATDEAAFLAGYLAAGMTKTGKVGTFGGIKIPTVTIFMKGFEAGVKYYNQKHGTKVEVLGWNTAKDEGLFTGNFESTDDGRRFAESLMDEGADIILPVAGPVGLGSAAACKERGTMLIGVDTDWYISAPEFKEVYLTSILKNMDVAVFDAIKAVADGTFKGGVYVGTLKNNGVGIAPFHEFDAKVPESLKAELEQIKADLIAGKITVNGVLGL